MGIRSTTATIRCWQTRLLVQEKDLQKALGFKHSKDRLKVLLCCNKTGSQVTSPGHREIWEAMVFHHVNMTTLPASYTYSKNAMMTSSVFEDWFHEEFVPKVR